MICSEIIASSARFEHRRYNYLLSVLCGLQRDGCCYSRHLVRKGCMTEFKLQHHKNFDHVSEPLKFRTFLSSSKCLSTNCLFDKMPAANYLFGKMSFVKCVSDNREKVQRQMYYKKKHSKDKVYCFMTSTVVLKYNLCYGRGNCLPNYCSPIYAGWLHMYAKCD